MPPRWTWGGHPIWTWPGQPGKPSTPTAANPYPKPPRPDNAHDPGLGYITFVSYNFEGYDYPQYSFTCLLGDGAPEISDGYGGWQVIDRARNVGLVQWNGRNPLTIKIPIMFDNFADGTSLEPDIRQLEKMAGAEINMKQPPLVLINSMGVVPHDAHDATQNDWVISEIEWGDSDRNEWGNRVRQAATVTVMEYTYDDVIGGIGARPSSKSKKKARGKNKRRHYVVHGANETLVSIAHKELKNSHLWRRIRDVNLNKHRKPIYRDPYKVIPMGTILTMPLK